MDNQGDANRRNSPRRDPRRFVTVQCRRGSLGLGTNLATIVLDVSMTGLRLIVTEALDVQGEVEILIDGQGLRRIKRLGIVRWQVEVGKDYFGIGIEFQQAIDYDDWVKLVVPE